jgi:diacylglycerol kinase family enzyme
MIWRMIMIHIFIINPYAGEKTFADDLREKLESIENLKYFVFNTRYKGYETELVKMVQKIFEGEELRFYCCGGSGTMRNILQGFDDMSKAEVAFFPCGLTNDYLKVFGKDKDRFCNVEELIDGDIIDIDYIESDYGVALNTFSLGLDSKIGDKFEEYRILRCFGKQVPYLMAILYSLIFSKPKKYEIELDDIKNIGKYAELVFGKGTVIGGNLCYADKVDLSDGKGRICLIGDKQGMSLASLIQPKKSKYDKEVEGVTYSEGSKFSFKCLEDNDSVTLNLDGELYRNVKKCSARVVNKGLKFVVPKGVTL